MPPKKKKRWFSSPDEKPGIAKQHLLDVFAQLPADRDSILNGHVLYPYVVECEKSRAVTERKLATFIDQSSMGVLKRNNLSLHFKAEIKKLIDKTLNKFKRLSSSEQFQKFDSICQGTFSLTPSDDDKDGPNFLDAAQPDEVLPISVQQPDTSTDVTETSSLDAAQPLPLPDMPDEMLVLVHPSPVKTRQHVKLGVRT